MSLLGQDVGFYVGKCRMHVQVNHLGLPDYPEHTHDWLL